MVLSFEEYDEIVQARQKLFNSVADSIISENLFALKELSE